MREGSPVPFSELESRTHEDCQGQVLGAVFEWESRGTGRLLTDGRAWAVDREGCPIAMGTVKPQSSEL